MQLDTLLPLLPCLLVLVAATLRLFAGSERCDLARVFAALLWLYCALSPVVDGANPGTPPHAVVAILAALEGLSLLIVGLSGWRSPRKAPWPSTTGGVLIGMAFILAASGFGVAEHRVASYLPRPWLELLTLGLLVAPPSRGRVAGWAAVLPLLSLATLQVSLLEAGWALRAALLAGFALGLVVFSDRPPIHTPYQEPEDVSIRLRELRERTAWPAWLGVVVAALAAVALGVVADPTWRAVVVQLAASAVVAALIATVRWSRLRLWAAPDLRYMAWRFARFVGRGRRWLRTGWHPAVAAAVATGVLLGLATYASAAADPDSLDWLLGGLTVSVPVLILVAHRVRRHVYVASFRVDGEDGTERGARLAARLRHELAAITSVYRTLDEALPSAEGRVSSLEVSVENIGELLEKTVDASLVSPLGKPNVGAVFGLARAAGLFRASQLTCSLDLGEGAALAPGTTTDALTRPASLTVELSGGGRRGSWRITEADLAGASGSTAEDEAAADETVASRMVRQAAYRIAAGVADLGSPRWEALESYTRGLRHYRNVRLTEVDRDLYLRKAEACFRGALEADTTFSQGHYNLGVVYTKLGELDAALAAFRHAIEADPKAYAPYLALAMAYFERAVELYFRGGDRRDVAEDFLQSQVFAGRAISLAPLEPRPWNVYSAAAILKEWQGLKPEAGDEHWRTEVDRVIDPLHVATALAWRRLYRSELAGTAAAAAEAGNIVRICTENLAEIYFEAGRPEESLDVLTQMLRLAPRRASPHLALGKALAASLKKADPPQARFERLTAARDELYQVHGDALPLDQRAGRWAWLLAVHEERLRVLAGGFKPAKADVAALRAEDEKGRRRALICLLDHAALPESLIFVDPDPRRVGVWSYIRRLDLLRHELALIHRHLPIADHGLWVSLACCFDVLEAVALGRPEQPSAELSETEWAQAQWDIREARLGLVDPEGKDEKPVAEAVRRLELAIAVLRREHPRQIRDQGLESLLGCAYLLRAKNEGDLEKKADWLHLATDYAFRGVAAGPTSAVRRMVLAAVHREGNDFLQASAEWHAALSLRPPLDVLFDAWWLDELERTWCRTPAGAAEGEGATPKPTEEAIGQVEDLLELLESAKVPEPIARHPDPRPLWFKEHAALHFRLGKLLAEAGRPGEARSHLQMALAAHHQPDESRRLRDELQPWR